MSRSYALTAGSTGCRIDASSFSALFIRVDICLIFVSWPAATSNPNRPEQHPDCHRGNANHDKGDHSDP